MNYFLRNSNIDFTHRHVGYRKSMIEVSAYFKNSQRMRTSVAIETYADEKSYEEASSQLFKIIFHEYPNTAFEKMIRGNDFTETGGVITEKKGSSKLVKKIVYINKSDEGGLKC